MRPVVGYVVHYTLKTSNGLRQHANIALLALESGVDESVRNKFPGADVTYGSAASGAGNNRDIPLSEGGDINPSTGKLYKAGDFENEGGPETKAELHRSNEGGEDDVRSNIRN